MKYSIIIPIFNAEETLKRCLDSLLPQLNSETEALLINDGSKDASGSICLEYVEKSSCFKYFEQENSGVSAARNTGIENAKGDYVLFIDSDDFVSSDMFELINGLYYNYDYDFLVSNLIFENDTKSEYEAKILFESDNMNKIIDRVSDMICNKVINAPLGKVYKRSIINEYEIRFPVGCNIAEDRSFNVVYALHIKSLAVVSGCFYHYAGVAQSSLSRTIRDTDELEQQFVIGDNMISETLMLSELEEAYITKIKAAENFCKCRQVYSRAKRMKQRGACRKDILLGIKADCKELNREKLFYPNTVYCKKIYYPVKLRLYRLIYYVSMKLAEKAV